MTEEQFLPYPPEVSGEELESCHTSSDFRPILFKWYKYVGSVCNCFACIELDSTALRNIPPLHFYVLVGLLNRCSRLILSNTVLSKEGQFGETTSIIDRCIYETAVKVMWLCKKDSTEHFERYLSDGLKTELELKKGIEKNIKDRGDIPLVVEERMLASIDRSIRAAKLSEAQIISSKKLPDVASMIGVVGYDRLFYVVSQKLGSHAVHGTWVDLYLNYLREDNEHLVPRDHDRPTHANQYVLVSVMVLESMKAFIQYASLDESVSKSFTELLDSIRDEILKIHHEALVNDYEPVSKEI